MASVDTLVGVPQHIRELLARLHKESSAQEAAIDPAERSDASKFHALMRDKFIALDEDKAQYVYQLLRSTNAKTVVEAGTSFGVSTIYLALAATANAKATGGRARVVATEYEPAKAAQARQHWKECGADVAEAIDLREGDLRETLKADLDQVDCLLLDIWPPVALPTLKLVQPKLRHGAVVVIDNTVSSCKKYAELLDYIRAPESGFVNATLPFSGGLDVCVYLPQKEA